MTISAIFTRGGGGGDSLIKVGRDVRTQALGFGRKMSRPPLDFLSKKPVKNRHQQINHTSRTANKNMNNEVDEGVRPIS